MEIAIYDKSKWSRGEWDNEPDRVDFIHAGFSCFILRNRTGNWCGYVGVPSTHSLYEKDYMELNVDILVHGGLTYADKCRDTICHIPQPGMPDDVWWFGFDTAHANDLTPYIPLHFDGMEYRNKDYAINETEKLAEQLERLA